jgi:acyl-CoA synthetase (AMP-forming)/AMP-acid ligase II/thioesterase domain-containing protein/acyl carrier protein
MNRHSGPCSIFSANQTEESGTKCAIGGRIAWTAAVSPESQAIVSTGRDPLSYLELLNVLLEIRARLRQEGIGRAARVGILATSPFAATLAILGVCCSAIAVPLDPRLPDSELARSLDQLELDALVLISDRSAARDPDLALPGVKVLRWLLDDSLMKPPGAKVLIDQAMLEEFDGDEPAFILRTSGTTAAPKLIPYTHSAMFAAARRWAHWFDLTSADRSLCVSAPYYSHGLKVSILIPLLTGGSVAFPASPADVDLHEWFEVLKPTWYSAGPALHRAVLEAARSQPGTISQHTLRFASSGGSPLPASTHAELEALLSIPILEHYGSSEAAQTAANALANGEARPGTVGRPWPGILEIVDKDGRPLPAGQMGEIRLRGPTVIKNYLAAPQQNAELFTDGWFRTGDLGRLDLDGYLTLHGRLSEQINRGGEKISPEEIDTVMLRHPALSDAAAFKVEHPRLGEDVAAAVVPIPGSPFDMEEFRDFLGRELVAYKIPQQIMVLDAIPRGITGKILRNQLTDRAQEASNPAADAGQPASPLNTLEGDLLGIWRRLLKHDSMTVRDSFREAGGDSLLAFQMLAQVERLVGRSIPESIIGNVDTVAELALALQESSKRDGEFIEFNSDPAAPALFWFHGDFIYGGYYLRRFAKLLGPHVPLCCIAPHGAFGGAVPATIQEMAADRAGLVMSRQPHGPYRLGGYCNGALVAFEAAKLLIEKGHEVELVVMVDPPGFNARPIMSTLMKSIERVLPKRANAVLYDKLTEIERAEFVWPLLKRYLSRPFRSPSDEESLPLPPDARARSDRNKLAYSLALSRYRPGYLDCPALFFEAEHRSSVWLPHFRSARVVKATGNHDQCIRDYAASIADPLRARLQAGRPAVT